MYLDQESYEIVDQLTPCNPQYARILYRHKIRANHEHTTSTAMGLRSSIEVAVTKMRKTILIEAAHTYVR
jgi:hypothetical protein